jgi:hypothetical protein
MYGLEYQILIGDIFKSIIIYLSILLNKYVNLLVITATC